MTDLSTIELVETIYPRVQLTNGGTRSHQKFYDFVVDGTPLSTLFAERKDMISCLWLPVTDATVRAVERLLLATPADLAHNRRSLYVCRECGDLGCGAVSVFIEKDETTILWHEFAFQNNYDQRLYPSPQFEQLGNLRFDRSHYEQMLQRIVQGGQRE